MKDRRLLRLGRMGPLMAPDAGGSTGGGVDAGETGDTGTAGGTDAGTGRTPSDDEAGQGSERTFTQADIDRIVRREQAKWKRQQETAVQQARTEAERLASMTAEERAREQARRREEELTRREAAITRRELRAQALETLAQRQLPAELIDLLDYADAERCGASIEAIGKTFSKAVQRGVEARVAGDAPKAGGEKGRKPMDMRGAIAAHYGQ